MMDKLNRKRDKIVDIQKALQTADINQDGKVDFDEWRQDLKTWVHTSLICSKHVMLGWYMSDGPGE